MARQLCRIAQTAVAYLAHLMVHLAHIQPSQYTLRKSGHAARPRHRQDDPSGDATSCQSHNMLGHAHAGSRGRIRRPDTCDPSCRGRAALHAGRLVCDGRMWRRGLHAFSLEE
eukprot:CAMPEP_0181185070 /NCGR_PEP_ID=MMETSP1096-20121128/9309_1 /TAXON_ID=156174 ORGANISM="Chrysochromulina ericina, Strain CCMP281" /NCGR_SAMPLE_ID=MMETSP1096 /ASSEMBLY_ACC=CAM_ASM_000453 /LENGTH=112 /DNA_ID=CAMNT_0023273885 /DNA_START=375 /DNA_END=713 /DNA_ORIENTATION=+